MSCDFRRLLHAASRIACCVLLAGLGGGSVPKACRPCFWPGWSAAELPRHLYVLLLSLLSCIVFPQGTAAAALVCGPPLRGLLLLPGGLVRRGSWGFGVLGFRGGVAEVLHTHDLPCRSLQSHLPQSLLCHATLPHSLLPHPVLHPTHAKRLPSAVHRTPLARHSPRHLAAALLQALGHRVHCSSGLQQQ
jgi:hypothetical protein